MIDLIDYLEHLLIEHAYLLRMPYETLVNALYATCPDPKGQLINLYETVTEADLRALLGERTTTAVSLTEATDTLLQTHHLNNDASRAYLTKTALHLLPRLHVQKDV